MSVNIKLEDNNLAHLKDKHSKASRVVDHKNNLKSKITETELRIAELEGGEIESTNEKIENLSDQIRTYNELQGQIKSAMAESDMYTRNITSLTKDLEVFHESDEELKSLLQEHLKSVLNKDAEQKECESHKMDAEEQLATVQAELSEQIRLSGVYQAEANVKLYSFQYF